MKNIKFVALLLMLFTLTGCDLIDNFSFTPNVNVNEDDDLNIIEDENYVYEPFLNLNTILNQSDFNENHSTLEFNLYPKTSESIIDEYINSYSFTTSSEYTIGAVYFSTEYETIYISYQKGEIGFLSAYELYLVERHAIAYFQSDEYRSEDKNYLRAVLIYPDNFGSSCSGEGVSGCAGYGGKHGVITLNATPNMNIFYNPLEHEPKRDTFAHEYGHISTFYFLSYKGDESYEAYLRLRLGDNYDLVYPDGMLGAYSATQDYKIQPEEIMADDFVELFYYRDQKYAGDNTVYEQKYVDLRNSLSDSEHSSFTYLAPNYSEPNYIPSTTFNNIKKYYTDNFYKLKRDEITPIGIEKKDNNKTFNYYDSVCSLNNIEELKSITSSLTVKLVAVEIVTKDAIEYYRVILSPLSKVEKILDHENIERNIYDKKRASDNMGYVRKDLFNPNYTIKVYQVLKGQVSSTEWEELNQNSLLDVVINGIHSSTKNIYITPFYDFTYVLNTSSNDVIFEMYDYFLNNYCEDFITTQNFRIAKNSLILVDN